MENNRNFILAIALSFAVIIGWDLLIWKPNADRLHKQQLTETSQSQQAPATSETAGSSVPPASTASPGPAASATGAPAGPMQPVPTLSPVYSSREAAIAASPRVSIESPALQGSINLKGARIDDVVFRNYKEAVNPKSPDVVLLSPSGSPHPYFTYTGWWTSEPGIKLPPKKHSGSRKAPAR